MIPQLQDHSNDFSTRWYTATFLDRGPCLQCFMENGLNMWDLLHGLQMWHVLDFSVDIPTVPVVPYEQQWHITEAVKQVTQDMLWQICKEWNFLDVAEQPSRHVLDTLISFSFPKCCFHVSVTFCICTVLCYSCQVGFDPPCICIQYVILSLVTPKVWF